jgi:diaminopimelate epimerase
MGMWLYQTGRVGTEFRIAMAERLIDVTVLDSDCERRTAVVFVTLGEPAQVNPSASGRLSFVRPAALAKQSLPDLKFPPAHVSMGNPHTVFFVDSMDTVDFDQLGPLIENHPEFPDRTNVEFVKVTGPASARIRVWERGSGETLACGSGACAVVVAGICNGAFVDQQPVTVAMTGGDLQVFWDSANNLHLQGPAQETFRGVVEI